MNRNLFRRAAASFVFACVMLPAMAASSRAILPFQGAVAVKPGQPALDGQPYGSRFEIFTAATGGTRVFEDIQQVTIDLGTFSVELGAGSSPLSPAIFRDNEDLWLQVTIDSDRSGTYDEPELIQPRIHLASAPLAFFATEAGRAQTAGRADTTPHADVAGTLDLPAQLKNDAGDTVAEIQGNGAWLPLRDFGEGDPERGAVYRDNSCLAWGIINSEGELLSGFGISNVSLNSSNGYYTVRLHNNVEMDELPAYSVSAMSIDSSARPELMVCEPTSDNEFRVYIFGLDLAEVVSGGRLDIPRVRSAFMVTVFGRPE